MNKHRISHRYLPIQAFTVTALAIVFKMRGFFALSAAGINCLERTEKYRVGSTGIPLDGCSVTIRDPDSSGVGTVRPEPIIRSISRLLDLRARNL